jgi:hypothetical protein
MLNQVKDLGRGGQQIAYPAGDQTLERSRRNPLPGARGND